MSQIRRIDYTNRFNKQLRKSPLKIKKAFRSRLKLYLVDPNSIFLNKHPLKGSYKGYQSINITGDWRAIFREAKEKTIFIALGTHSQLYK